MLCINPLPQGRGFIRLRLSVSDIFWGQPRDRIFCPRILKTCPSETTSNTLKVPWLLGLWALSFKTCFAGPSLCFSLACLNRFKETICACWSVSMGLCTPLAAGRGRSRYRHRPGGTMTQSASAYKRRARLKGIPSFVAYEYSHSDNMWPRIPNPASERPFD